MRSSWRASIALVLLIGLGGGVALAVAAGARRTASAFDTILAFTNTRDLAADYGPEDPARIEALVRAVDGVADVSMMVGFQGLLTGDKERREFTIFGRWNEPVTVSRGIVTAGRAPGGANEVLLNQAAATALGVRLGDSFELALPEPSFSDFETVVLEVVGMVFESSDIVEDARLAYPILNVSRAFTERHLDRAFWGQADIEISRGASPGAVAAALAGTGLQIDEDVDEDRNVVQLALRPLLGAMTGLAVLAAVATAVVSGQALSRIVRRRPTDDRSLRALGATTGHLVGADLLVAATVATAGASIAIGAALLASPLFPIGPARRSGLFRGISADVTVLGLGGAVLVVAIAALVGFGSWRRRDGSQVPAPGRAPAMLSARPAAATGLRLATGQRGLVASVGGVAAAMSVVVACATFTGSLDRLIDDPELVGMTWDAGAQGGGGFARLDTDQLRSAVRDDPAFERVTALGYYGGTIGEATVPVAVLDALKGSPWPPIVAGRAPLTSDEVLVGRDTLDALGIEIGEKFTISFPEDLDAADPSRTQTVALRYTVVGSAVAPDIGQPGQLTPRLGVGILLAPDALGPLAPLSASFIALLDVPSRAGSGTVLARFPDGLPFDSGAASEWFTSVTPPEVSNAAEAGVAIRIGVGALAVAIVATVVHTLLGSVRQRRREYAVLKALGFTRRQVGSTVLWQSGAVLGPAVVLAVPVGVGAGRWLWRAFAEDLGIVAAPVVPLILLVAGGLATVLVVEAAALLPASIARRTPVARTLRAE